MVRHRMSFAKVLLQGIHSVHSSSFCEIFKKDGLTRSRFLEGGCWERGYEFFQAGCSFYIKNKLKYDIINVKKVYK